MKDNKDRVKKSSVIPNKYKDQYYKDKEQLKKEHATTKKRLSNQIDSLNHAQISSIKTYLLKFS